MVDMIFTWAVSNTSTKCDIWRC